MLAPLSKHRKPRVLVLDDEPLIADSLALILSQSEYEARAVYNGSAAVETAKSWPPDLLLADIILPGMNGVETALQIHAIFPDCKLLFISGDLTTADLLDGYRDQGHDFHALAKPIPPAELLAQVGKVMIPAAL